MSLGAGKPRVFWLANGATPGGRPLGSMGSAADATAQDIPTAPMAKNNIFISFS